MTDEQRFKYACWCYYLSVEPEHQSPLSDWEFDELRVRLGRQPQDSYMVAYELTNAEIHEAKKWAESHNNG